MRRVGRRAKANGGLRSSQPKYKFESLIVSIWPVLVIGPFDPLIPDTLHFTYISMDLPFGRHFSVSEHWHTVLPSLIRLPPTIDGCMGGARLTGTAKSLTRLSEAWPLARTSQGL